MTRTVNTTIAASTSITPEIYLVTPGLAAIETAAWTPAVMSFTASVDNGATDQSIYFRGNEYAIPIGATQFQQIDGNIFLGVTALRLRSGTLGAPVPQVSAAALTLVGSFSGGTPFISPNPSCTRILEAPLPGYAGVFPSFTASVDDTCTFDLSGQLSQCAAPIETITSAQFALSVIGPIGTTDGAPQTRILSLFGVTGTDVSVQLGGWQSGVPYILYRLDVICTTSRGNTLSAWGYVPVYSPVA